MEIASSNNLGLSLILPASAILLAGINARPRLAVRISGSVAEVPHQNTKHQLFDYYARFLVLCIYSITIQALLHTIRCTKYQFVDFLLINLLSFVKDRRPQSLFRFTTIFFDTLFKNPSYILN